MNHLAIARASCEGREGTHPALRPNGSGLMVITILASDGGSNPPCGTRRFMNQQKKNLMKTNNQKGFATVSTPDGRYRIWLPRPTSSGVMRCSCSFGLRNRLQLIDAIDALNYVRVDEVNEIDQDYSTFVITCLHRPFADCLEKLMDDLPEVMEKNLIYQV